MSYRSVIISLVSFKGYRETSLGIFTKVSDFFARRRMARFAKAARNRRAIKEDRWLALEALASYEADFAVPSLLARFEFHLDNGILDAREKERAMTSLLTFPAEQVVPLVKQQLQTTEFIAWPCKILLKLTYEHEVVGALVEALDFSDIAFDRAKIDKNYDILCQLQDFTIGELDKNFAQFLQDSDERIRFAAAELLIKQEVTYAPEVLEEFVRDDSSENTRIKQIVIDAFIKHGWPITDKRNFKKSSVAKEVVLHKSGKLIKRI